MDANLALLLVAVVNSLATVAVAWLRRPFPQARRDEDPEED